MVCVLDFLFAYFIVALHKHQSQQDFSHIQLYVTAHTYMYIWRRFDHLSGTLAMDRYPVGFFYMRNKSQTQDHPFNGPSERLNPSVLHWGLNYNLRITP